MTKHYKKIGSEGAIHSDQYLLGPNHRTRSDDDESIGDAEQQLHPKSTLPSSTSGSSGEDSNEEDSDSDSSGCLAPTKKVNRLSIALLLLGGLAVAAIPTTLVLLNKYQEEAPLTTDLAISSPTGENIFDKQLEPQSSTPYPTLTPTLPPSPSPSLAPTELPTQDPTLRPTAIPTSAPTPRPTPQPTDRPTNSPTRPNLPDDYTFRLKMHWEPQYCWQEECSEQRWCIECTRCDRISGSGEPLDICSDPNNNDGNDCAPWDQLWIQNCNGWRGSSGNARFEILRQPDEEWDRIRIADTNLCMERAGGRFLNLQTCSDREIKQRFVGFDPDGAFSLRPFEEGYQDRCLSQHHWPKKYELLYLEDCDLALFWDTGLWEAL